MTRSRSARSNFLRATILTLSFLVVGDVYLIQSADARRGEPAGSVRSSNRAKTNKAGPSKHSPGHPARGPTAGPSHPGARPPASAGRKRAHRKSHYRHASWHNARDNYRRWRRRHAVVRLGVVIATRPKQTTTVVVTGSTYYYSGGVYYVQSGTNYVVTAPPPGAVVYAVPADTTVVYVNEDPYYYYGGTYYVVTDAPAEVPPPVEEGYVEPEGVPESPPMAETSEDENYEVVSAPVGASVPYLPDEATEQKIDGTTYFVYDSTYYKPFASDDDIVYMVVANPLAT